MCWSERRGLGWRFRGYRWVERTTTWWRGECVLSSLYFGVDRCRRYVFWSGGRRLILLLKSWWSCGVLRGLEGSLEASSDWPAAVEDETVPCASGSSTNSVRRAY